MPRQTSTHSAKTKKSGGFDASDNANVPMWQKLAEQAAEQVADRAKDAATAMFLPKLKAFINKLIESFIVKIDNPDMHFELPPMPPGLPPGVERFIIMPIIARMQRVVERRLAEQKDLIKEKIVTLEKQIDIATTPEELFDTFKNFLKDIESMAGISQQQQEQNQNMPEELPPPMAEGGGAAKSFTSTGKRVSITLHGKRADRIIHVNKRGTQFVKVDGTYKRLSQCTQHK